MMAKYIPPHKREQKFTKKRRDLSQASKFNTKIEMLNAEPIKSIQSIKIPEIVTPTIVKSPPDSPENTERKLNSKEFELMELIANTKKEREYREMVRWNEHYEKELNDMYMECVDPTLDISFDDFIHTAYLCSNKEYDEKAYKQIRPLI